MSLSTFLPAFLIWRKEHLKYFILDEVEYDRALLDAERLKAEGMVTHETWREMVRQANEALIRNTKA